MNEKFNKETKICEKEPSEVLEMYISIAKLNTHTHILKSHTNKLYQEKKNYFKP
jgi:hypothetical protein